jgi:hypothetical protein
MVHLIENCRYVVSLRRRKLKPATNCAAERAMITSSMQSRTIAMIGGTGKQGSGFALRWDAGHRVLIGSLAPERTLLPDAADG